MQTKYPILLLFFALASLAQAQYDVTVHIREVVRYNEPYIKITLTNNNEKQVMLMSGGDTDNWSVPNWKCKTEYYFNALSPNPNDTTVLFESHTLGFMDLDKILRIRRSIALNKGESFSYDARLYADRYWTGIFYQRRRPEVKRVQCIIDSNFYYDSKFYKGVFKSNTITLSPWAQNFMGTPQ